MHDHSETLNELVPALIRAKETLAPVLKTGKNAHLKNTYADLNDVTAAADCALTAEMLVVVQGGTEIDGATYLSTMLIHSSGQWIRGLLPLVAEAQKGVNLQQATGSAISYMRRYGLVSLLQMQQTDDDGATAATSQHSPKNWQMKAEEAAKKLERIHPVTAAEVIGKLMEPYDTQTQPTMYSDLTDEQAEGVFRDICDAGAKLKKGQDA
jgi:hypothetical protein